MSAGYFSRLAQRARGESGGIRPVIAPLYEGQAFTFEDTQANAARPAAATERAPGEPATGRAAARAAPSVEPSRPILQVVENREIETHTRVIRENVRAEPVRQSAPPEGKPTSAPARAEAAPPAEMTSRPQVPAKPPEGEVVPQLVPVSVSPAPRPPAPEQGDATLLPLQPPEKHSEHAPVSQENSAPERTEPAPPPVRIHIGRIEVRAVQPPPPAPAPRVDPHPAMSLDEYLRRLNEERR